MIDKVIKIIEENNLIEDGKTIYVGTSGGPDSMCLLTVLDYISKNELSKNNFNVVCVHVNHMLYGIDSDNDMNYVHDYCKDNDIECIIYEKDIKKLSKSTKKTVEECGRDYRYKKFRDLLKDGDKVAIAHNLSDNAETMLMHLFRGTGLKGLCSMSYENNGIIRPLLDVSRDEIVSYLDNNGIEYQIDKTNLEPVYQRNKVRLEVIPYIKKTFNDNIITSLNRSIKNFNIDNAYLEEVSTKAYNESVITDGIYDEKMIALDLEKLCSLHESILIRVFQKAFTKINGTQKDLSFTNITDLKELLKKASGKKIILNSSICVYKGYSSLIWYNEKDFDFNKNFCYDVKINELFYFENADLYVYISDIEENSFTDFTILKSAIFCFDKLEENESQFFIRNKKDDDKIFIKSIDGHKSIKKYFSEEKIDTIFRNEIGMLATNENLLMILDKKLICNDNFISNESDNCDKRKYYVSILKNNSK